PALHGCPVPRRRPVPAAGRPRAGAAAAGRLRAPDFDPAALSGANAGPVIEVTRARLGLLVAGSVAEGLSARLDPTVPIEDVRLGKFVKIVGQKYEYFCLVTDVQLDSANNDVLRDSPGDPDRIDEFLRHVLSGT